MSIRPLRQFNAVLQQEYFEPTISWAFRVVLALNVPLIVMPLYLGFSREIIWTAFGAYLVALTEYRGLHYKKVMIQSLEALLITFSASLGMLVSGSIVLSVLAMFAVGIFAAFIRNWSDYGANIGVAVGFFFLFGLSAPRPMEEIPVTCLYILLGAGWAILITIFSFPLRPAKPFQRSVARIWKTNTDLMDSLVLFAEKEEGSVEKEIPAREAAIRSAISNSVDLFSRSKAAEKEKHYDKLMELRRVSALFSACLSSMHEELEIIGKRLRLQDEATLYKTLSAFAQASARMAIVVYTTRPEDLAMLQVRFARCGVALEVFRDSVSKIELTADEKRSLEHLIHTLETAYRYLLQATTLVEEKMKIDGSGYFETYRLSYNNFISGLRRGFMYDFFSNFLNVNSEQFRYALRVAVLLSIGVFIFLFFKIDHGYWIPLTMMIVIQPYYGATKKKGIERLIGTVGGIVAGGLLMMLPLPHTAFVGMLVLVSFFVAYFLRNNYKVGVFFVTIMMVVLMQLTQQGTLQLIGWRLLSTLIGALLAFLAVHVLWPVWETDRFPVLLQRAILSVREYFDAVLSQKKNGNSGHPEWYRRRRYAEESVNHAFASVQRMMEEPGDKKEHVDILFSMVGGCIRLNREITSIALLSEKIKRFEPAVEMIGREADKIFETAAGTALTYTPAEKPQFDALKSSLNACRLENDKESKLMRSELEKIVFELEAMIRMQAKFATEFTD
jgi:uncharacterized membrane protein YccC